MAKLRNILNSHNVTFPSSAKKSELIEIFEKEIIPNAPQLLAEYTARIGNSHDEGFLNATDNDEEASEKEDKLTPKRERKKIQDTAESTPEKSKIKTEHAKVAKPKSKKETKRKDDEGSTRKKTKDGKRLQKADSKQHKSGGSNVEETKHNSAKEEPESEIENSEFDATENLSSFSDQNVFQSSKETSKPSRKRKLESNNESNVPTKKLKSPPATNRTRITKSPSKSIFDDSDSDIFDRTAVGNVDDKKYNKSLVKEEVADTKTPKTVSTKKTKSLSPSTNEKSFKSLEEEMANFDKQLELVKQRHVSDIPVEKEVDVKPFSQTPQSPNISNELAQLLGITIQGFQPPVVPSQVQHFNQSGQIDPVAPLNNLGNESLNSHSDQFNERAHSDANRSSSTIRNFTPQKAALIDDQKEHVLEEITTPKSSSRKKKKRGGETPSEYLTPRSKEAPRSKETPKSSQSSRGNKTPATGRKNLRGIRTPLGRVALTPKPRLLSINSTQNVLDSEEEEEIKEVNEKIKQYNDSKHDALDNLAANTESMLLTTTVITFFTWIVAMFFGLFGYWYYEQKYLVGYCGQEIDQPTFGDSSVVLVQQLGNALDTYCKPDRKSVV